MTLTRRGALIIAFAATLSLYMVSHIKSTSYGMPYVVNSVNSQTLLE